MRFRALPSLLALFLPLSEGYGSTRPAYATYTFGMSLTTGLNNELFTLFIVKEYEGQVLMTDPVTRGQFVLQAQGAMPSKANADAVNYFRKYKVASCLPPEELDDGRTVVPDCAVFDELWKLRFWEYPFVRSDGQRPGLGWAEQRNAPSPRQLFLLADYGFLTAQTMIRGEDVFRLLHDIGDPDWVDNYRKGY